MGSSEPATTVDVLIVGAGPFGLMLANEVGRRSLFDLLGFEWTLLRLGPSPPEGESVVAAARELGMDLQVVDVPTQEALDLYEAPLTLIRPDQVVAWRGSADADAAIALAIVHRS